MADRETNLAAYGFQVAYCLANDAPITARINTAIASIADEATKTGSRIINWPGLPTPDALPLRTAAPFHALYQAGRTPQMKGVYKGTETDADAIAHIMRNVLLEHDEEICAWLDTPPQTNEPGRSATLMCGLKILADRHKLPLEILEIGSSAGLNLMIARFSMNLGGSLAGPVDSPIHIEPEWRGQNTLPEICPEICSIKGVDIDPMFMADEMTETRLLAYIWPEHKLRFERTAKAIDMAKSQPVDLAQGDAADWIEEQLAKPQEEGTMRVLMHSIMWQYLPPATQKRIFDAMTKAGQNATESKPLGWVSVEADRNLNRHDLNVSSWPGHSDPVNYAHAHAHGFWVEWLDNPKSVQFEP